LNHTLRAFGFAPAVAGQPYYVTDENGEKTYSASIGDDGTISNLKLFAERGGESVTWDEKGNVYIAAGQVYVYNPAGELIDTIDIPERPSQLLFGGSDGNTLFVLARTSIYAVEVRNRVH
jgi:sugar lactone lactonase YvrE